MKFRKKPTVIEAEQFLEGRPLPTGVCVCDNGIPHLHTIHRGQVVYLTFGDWVIPERDGEHYYPCRPSVFEETYEPELG